MWKGKWVGTQMGTQVGDTYENGRLYRVRLWAGVQALGILRRQEQQWKSWDLSVKQAVSPEVRIQQSRSETSRLILSYSASEWYRS